MNARVVSCTTCGTFSPCIASRSSSLITILWSMMEANLVASASKPGRYRSSLSTSLRTSSGSLGSEPPPGSNPDSAPSPPAPAVGSGRAPWSSGASASRGETGPRLGAPEGPVACFWSRASSLPAVRSEESSSSSFSSSGTAPSTNSPGSRSGERAKRRGPGICWLSSCCCRSSPSAVWLTGFAAACDTICLAAASTTAATSSRITCWMKLPCGERRRSSACSDATSSPWAFSVAEVEAV
mmetsp:Transcript_6946/g.16382  ORF Transcript_6946/g.16382 Transcript_6946/m.16382 type:complete len:240 (+) Transcript_6946:378-1097(+)